MTNKIIMLFLVSLLLVSSVNVGSSYQLPPRPNLAELIQISDSIVEVTVVDIQETNYTVKINEILKTNQDIEVEEEIIFRRGSNQNLSIGDHRIVVRSSTGGYPEIHFVQEGDIYSSSFYRISLEDLKTLIQKSDDYLERYDKAYHYDDIVVAKMLTDTDVNQMKYGSQSSNPHQIHKIEVIYSTTGKLTGNTEFDYMMWFFPKKILQEIDHIPYFIKNWTETSDGYYLPDRWDPESSFLKKGDYYIIYAGDRDYARTNVTMAYEVDHIQKYDSKNKKELRQFIEEYQEMYELVQKYEGGQGSQTLERYQNESEKSSIPGFSFIFAIAVVISLAGFGLYQRRKKQ